MSDKVSETGAYIYVQFESRRKGYIDDMEFNLAKGVCHVRTSSRLGYTDSGVNAKRFNWFALRLGSTDRIAAALRSVRCGWRFQGQPCAFALSAARAARTARKAEKVNSACQMWVVALHQPDRCPGASLRRSPIFYPQSCLSAAAP